MIAPLLGRIHRPGWFFGRPARQKRGPYDRGAVAAAGPLPRLRADCGSLSVASGTDAPTKLSDAVESDPVRNICLKTNLYLVKK